MREMHLEWSFQLQATRTRGMRHSLWLFVIRNNIQ